MDEKEKESIYNQAREDLVKQIKEDVDKMLNNTENGMDLMFDILQYLKSIDKLK